MGSRSIRNWAGFTDENWSNDALRSWLGSLQAMQRSCINPLVHFLPVQGATRFSVLVPTNQLIARKNIGDEGPMSGLTLTETELNQRYAR